MKNIKNTLATLAMAAVLGVGTVSANTGLIITDRSATGNQDMGQCSTVKANFFTQFAGIITGTALDSIGGLIITDRDGLIITDRNCQATQNRDGLIITD